MHLSIFIMICLSAGSFAANCFSGPKQPKYNQNTVDDIASVRSTLCSGNGECRTQAGSIYCVARARDVRAGFRANNMDEGKSMCEVRTTLLELFHLFEDVGIFSF